MNHFIETLKKEVVVAQGCTEPIAVSYAVSLAVEDLAGEALESLDLWLSTNIIKNAMGVGIPGTGEIGLEIAAALGAVILRSDKKLEILCGFTPEQLTKARELMQSGKIKVKHQQTKETLYIEVCAKSANHESQVVLAREHTHLIHHEKDHQVIYHEDLPEAGSSESADDDMSVKSILEFVRSVDHQEIAFLLDGAKMNKSVSDEGLKNQYGLQVGSKISQSVQDLLANNAANRIIAATAAASDARMDGCAMPIMTTAGSGNQGIACTLPVLELAAILGKNEEETCRALALSNLITIHMKHYMGRLSPLCGAGIAGTTGSCCGMTYLLGGSDEQIKCAITDMISDLSGMICDGAKSTCALKIATSTNAAIQCATLAMNNISPSSKEGIIFDDVEETIRHLGKLVKQGLCTTDETILDIMLEK